jgi:hypothetical protein
MSKKTVKTITQSNNNPNQIKLKVAKPSEESVVSTNELTIDRYNDGASQMTSGQSFISSHKDEDFRSMNNVDFNENIQTIESEIDIVSTNEISSSICELRLLLTVFEDNSMKFLFGEDAYIINISRVIEIFKKKLELSNTEATKLARFLIEPRDKERIVYRTDKSKNIIEINNRISELVGKYK